ncbi:MAG: response regulator [Acidobacteriota bacterium]|nr:response regulator [Acidobacteriota bacterium]
MVAQSIVSDPQTPPPILIVEDDQPTQLLLQTLVRRSGFAPEVAADGIEAMARLRTTRYAAVILDMMMPQAGGREVLAFLSAANLDTPILICSAAGPSALTGFDPAIVKAIVRKPFDVDQFAAALTSVARTLPPRAKILLVEDDERARYILRDLIGDADVSVAESGDTAMDMIRRERPDVVMLDLILPGTPGEEILEQIGAADEMRDMSVVVVTSRALNENDRARLLQRAVAVIYKGDLSRETLQDALNRARRR